MISPVKFPLSVTFENGEVETYVNEKDLICNLEEYDSESETQCKIVDSDGREVFLVLKLLDLKELHLKTKFE
jgi:hypothetical protein